MLVLIAQQQQIPAAYVTWLVPLVILGVIVQFGFGTFVTVLLYLGNKATRQREREQDQWRRERERMEDSRGKEIELLRQKVDLSEDERHRLVEKYVEKQLREMTHKIGNETGAVLTSLADVRAQVATSLKDLKEKIGETEKQIDSLGEGKHKLELQTLEAVTKLQVDFAQNGARRYDLQQHQQGVDEKFNEMNQRMNDLATKDDLERMRTEMGRA